MLRLRGLKLVGLRGGRRARRRVAGAGTGLGLTGAVAWARAQGRPRCFWARGRRNAKDAVSLVPHVKGRSSQHLFHGLAGQEFALDGVGSHAAGRVAGKQHFRARLHRKRAQGLIRQIRRHIEFSLFRLPGGHPRGGCHDAEEAGNGAHQNGPSGNSGMRGQLHRCQGFAPQKSSGRIF